MQDIIYICKKEYYKLYASHNKQYLYLFNQNITNHNFKKTDTLGKAAYCTRMQTYFYCCKLLHMENNNELTLTLATH